MKTKFRILAFAFSMLMLCSVAIVGVSAEEVTVSPYENRVLELFEEEYGLSEFGSYFYEEHFEYHAADPVGEGSAPDYIMVHISEPVVSEVHVVSYIGEYVLLTGPYTPYQVGYHIYVPETDMLYTLE